MARRPMDGLWIPDDWVGSLAVIRNAAGGLPMNGEERRMEEDGRKWEFMKFIRCVVCGVVGET